MYKLINEVLDADKKVISPAMIKRTTDSSFIPKSEDNPDYQEYLKWVEAGNKPTAAD